MPKISDGWKRSGEFAITNGQVSIVKAFVKGEPVYTLHFKSTPSFFSTNIIGPFPSATAAEEFWVAVKRVLEYGEQRRTGSFA